MSTRSCARTTKSLRACCGQPPPTAGESPTTSVVTGWDDTSVAARTHPPLTTVRQPMHELGSTCQRQLLFDHIEGRPTSSVVLRTSAGPQARAADAHSIDQLPQVNCNKGIDHESFTRRRRRSRASPRPSWATPATMSAVLTTCRTSRHRQRSAGRRPRGTSPSGRWARKGENLDVLADAFMEEFPDVSVDVTAVPWDAAHDRIVTAIAGGEVPDVSLIGTTWMGEFATLGGLEPTPDEHRLVAVLRGRLGHDRGGWRQLRRAVVRGDPGVVLPHRPRRGGRLQPGAGGLGRAHPARPGH